jgi:PTS system cellobiose-specific IIC component
MIISVILIGILWTLGLHGDAIVLVFIQPVWLSNMSENLKRFRTGCRSRISLPSSFTTCGLRPAVPGAAGAGDFYAAAQP